MTELSTESLNALMPFGAHLGFELVESGPEKVIATIAWAEHLTTAGGALHGGALMSLADSVGATVAFLNLPAGASTSTISSSSVFLRGVRKGPVTATGRLVHAGRTTIVVETELVDEHDRPVLRTTQTQVVLHPNTP
jgi:1,4-dihydroxy-2-naphthoyl-CoA hydrolase